MTALMQTEDFFTIDSNIDLNDSITEMTKDEFINKTKSLLRLILEKYTDCHEKKYNDDDENAPDCNRCHGNLYIESGGNIIDCDSCKGTGIEQEVVFDKDCFIEFIEHEVIFGKEPFLESMECIIINNQN